MNEVQREHLGRIQSEFSRLVQAKYEQGAKEHGTVLSEDFTPEQLLDFAIEEAIDQVTYLLTMRELMDVQATQAKN